MKEYAEQCQTHTCRSVYTDRVVKGIYAETS